MVNSDIKITEKTLKDDLHYKGSIVVSYKISYPMFFSSIFLNTANKLNFYYYSKAIEYERYIRNILFREAVKEYEYSIKNDIPIRTFEAVSDFKITYNENCTLSLYFDRYEFKGGAHGTTLRYSDNWNLKKARRISLKEMFPDNINYKTYVINNIISQIEKQISQGDNIYFDEYKKNVVKYFNENSFYLSQNGITIYYQQYEIAPYAAGIVEFTIPYSIYPKC